MDGGKMAEHNQRYGVITGRHIRLGSQSVDRSGKPIVDCSVCGSHWIAGSDKPSRAKEVHQTIQRWIIGLSGTAFGLVVLGVLTETIR